LVSRDIEAAPLSRIVLLLLIGAIGLGAFFEASIFRIAIFDPIDFCNQSLGAAIAALAFLANPPQLPMSGGDVGLVVIIVSAWMTKLQQELIDYVMTENQVLNGTCWHPSTSLRSKCGPKVAWSPTTSCSSWN